MTTVDEQKGMFNTASSRVSRLYQAVQELRDEGMTRQEFMKACDRRPDHYGPVAYLAQCPEFWRSSNGPISGNTESTRPLREEVE